MRQLALPARDHRFGGAARCIGRGLGTTAPVRCSVGNAEQIIAGELVIPRRTRGFACLDEPLVHRRVRARLVRRACRAGVARPTLAARTCQRAESTSLTQHYKRFRRRLQRRPEYRCRTMECVRSRDPAPIVSDEPLSPYLATTSPGAPYCAATRAEDIRRQEHEQAEGRRGEQSELLCGGHSPYARRVYRHFRSKEDLSLRDSSRSEATGTYADLRSETLPTKADDVEDSHR